MNIAWSHLGHHWLNATIAGVGQGLALAAVVWLLLKCLRRTNAATRHAIRWTALLVIAALPVVHWIIAVVSFQRPEPSSSREASVQTLPSPSAPSMPTTPLTFQLPHEPIVVFFEEDFKEVSTSSLMEERTRSLVTPVVTSPAQTVLDEPYAALSPAKLPGSPAPFKQLTLPHGTGLVLMTVWIFLACIRLLFLGRQSLALAKLTKRGRAPAEEWRRRFESLRNEMGLKRKVRLRMVPTLNGPIVTGLWRPAILFPAELPGQLEARDWERIMRHELAHVARYDDWTNAWEQLIAAVWFFHPAVWWLKRGLALDREIACDDHVLATPSPARRYALLLAQFASQTQNRKWTAAPAAWNHRSQLKQRINMLLDPTRNASPRLSRTRAGTLLVALGLAAAGAFQFTPILAFSQDSPSADDQPAPPRKEKVSKIEVSKEALSSEDAARNESILSARRDVAVAPPPPLAPPAPPPPPAPPRAAASEVSAQATGDYLRPKSPAREFQDDKPREESLERRMERLERMVEQVIKMQTPPGHAEDGEHAERGSRRESGAHANILRKERRSVDILDAVGPPEKDKSAKGFFNEAEEQFKSAQKELHDAFKQADLAQMHRLHVLKQKDHLAMERQILEEQRRIMQRELEILERRIAEIEATRSADQDRQDDNGFWLKRKDSQPLPSN